MLWVLPVLLHSKRHDKAGVFCRRMLQQKWQRVVKQALELGLKQARKLEEELWKSQGLVVHISPRHAAKSSRQHAMRLCLHLT